MQAPWDAQRMRIVLIRRQIGVALIILLALGLAGWRAAFGQAPQPPATIMLIRHAEKLTDGREDLSPAGFARAKAIPKLFGGPAAAAPHNLPKPDFLFATHVSKHSNRPVETITPLSAALGLPISHDVDDKDFAALAKELLSGKYAGRVVLVAWHHGSIPAFARALGAAPPYDPWPDTQFDRVWKIDFEDGKVTLTDLPQGLMAGDSK
jgi:broad specificity phosphatase PhoE